METILESFQPVSVPGAVAPVPTPGPWSSRVGRDRVHAWWWLWSLVGATVVFPNAQHAAAKAAPPRLQVERWEPFLSDAQGRRARDLLRAGDYANSVKILRRYAAPSKPQRNQARFLLAYALLEAGEHDEAARLFQSLTIAYPLLEDYHRYHGARALYRAKRFARALALAGQIQTRSTLHVDALLLQADCHGALGQHDEAATIWRQYLSLRPGGSRADQAHWALAETLQRRARAPAAQRSALLAEAIEHYKKIMVHHPTSQRTPRAQTRIKTLAGQLPDGARLARLTAKQIYQRSRVHYGKMRNVAAERGFGDAVKKGGLSPDLSCRACYYKAKSVFRQRQRARSAPLFDRCVATCDKAGNRDLTIKSLYNAGRGLTNKGDHGQAIKRFERIERDHATHSYADDARMRAAEAYDEWGKTNNSRHLLSTLPKRYPDGDMAPEALWRLALRAYLAGDFRRALRHLDRVIKLGPDRVYFAEGRALYWKARILQRQKKYRPSRSAYQRCIREYPLSYYALLSFNRLRRMHRHSYDVLARELIDPIGHRPGRWGFVQSPLTRKPAFRRGVELARLGFAASAGRELARAGLSVRATTDTDQLWLAAVVYDRAQLWHLSHYVPRSKDRLYRREYPLRDNYRRWNIAYPRAYGRLVTSLSRQATISPRLAWSIMREESGFKRTIESWANAIGLMQLILPTAKAAGKRHGLRITRQSLLDPETNIRLGTTYLRFLLRTYKGVVQLAIAGYNGGHGAVYRWLTRFKGSTLDEFVERIPYVQTRRYTKRVLSTYFAYNALYGQSRPQRIPRLQWTLPNAAKPRFKPTKRPRKTP